MIDQAEERLLAACVNAATNYSLAVNELRTRPGVLPAEDYERLRERVEGARRACAKAQRALEGYQDSKG
jgi:hypothetical protein